MKRYLDELGATSPYILSFPGDTKPAEVYEEHVQRAHKGEFYALSAIDFENGSVIACTSCSLGNRYKIQHIATIGTGVLPAWQGAGLGKWMLDRCIEDMRNHPVIQRLELTVIKGNDRAHTMYEKAGFVYEGVKSRSIRQPDGTFVDEIQMGMWVGDSSALDKH